MVGPDDVVQAVDTVSAALAPHVDGDWSRAAGELAWTCRQTLDHVPDTLLLYAAHLALRAPQGVPWPRLGDADASPRRLLAVAVETAHVLGAVVRDAGPDVRAYHPTGMADAEGFCAMGCDELLIHGKDIAVGLGVPFEVPGDLVPRVLERLFPWAPNDVDPWMALLWANGRTSLPGRGRLGDDWVWHAGPPSEWDGVVGGSDDPAGWS